MQGSASFAARHVRLFTVAGGEGFLDHLFDGFTGFARTLLNPANQFFLLAFGILEIIIREFGPFLFQFTFGDVPVAFDFECVHISLCFLCYRHRDGEVFLLLFTSQAHPHNGKSIVVPVRAVLFAAAGKFIDGSPGAGFGGFHSRTFLFVAGFDVYRLRFCLSV